VRIPEEGMAQMKQAAIEKISASNTSQKSTAGRAAPRKAQASGLRHIPFFKLGKHALKKEIMINCKRLSETLFPNT
jgi:hypothetical protein